MARIPKITRTIKTTEVTILCLDTQTAEPSNQTFTLPRTYKDTDDMLKKAKAMYETSNYKLVDVVNFAVIEEKYEMDEIDFISKGKKVDRGN